MRIFQNVSDIGNLQQALKEAMEIKEDRYKYSDLGKNKTCLLIFFNNSLRTRLSTQKAAMNLGMNVIVLDVNQGAWKQETERGVVMDGDKSEHLLEAIPVINFGEMPLKEERDACAYLVPSPTHRLNCEDSNWISSIYLGL